MLYSMFMSNHETPGASEKWFRRDLEEESKSVKGLLKMLERMLADDHGDYFGYPRVTTVKLAFGLIIENGHMQTWGNEEHLGILLGLSSSPDPCAVIADYEVWQHGPLDNRGEPIWSNRIQSSDIAEVPIRLMYGVFGATGTHEDFEALKNRNEPI